MSFAGKSQSPKAFVPSRPPDFTGMMRPGHDQSTPFGLRRLIDALLSFFFSDPLPGARRRGRQGRWLRRVVGHGSRVVVNGIETPSGKIDNKQINVSGVISVFVGEKCVVGALVRKSLSNGLEMRRESGGLG